MNTFQSVAEYKFTALKSAENVAWELDVNDEKSLSFS